MIAGETSAYLTLDLRFMAWIGPKPRLIRPPARPRARVGLGAPARMFAVAKAF
jgi:hypothetical protein